MAVALNLTLASCGADSNDKASTADSKGEIKQVFNVAMNSELPTI